MNSFRSSIQLVSLITKPAPTPMIVTSTNSVRREKRGRSMGLFVSLPTKDQFGLSSAFSNDGQKLPAIASFFVKQGHEIFSKIIPSNTLAQSRLVVSYFVFEFFH